MHLSRSFRVKHHVVMSGQELLQFFVEFWWLLVKIFYSVALTVYQTLLGVEEKPVEGEVVLITGAGHGMGKELALLYASKGATVVAWDINADRNQETIAAITDLGRSAYAYKCDVSNREDVFATAQKVREDVGDVTILINNAGVMPSHPILDHTREEVQSVFGVNVLAHVWTVQAFLPAMKRKNHGHIVALSSCVGLFGLPNLTAYSASKFAVFGMMESLYEEFRAENLNIMVTTVCPYMVDTGLCKKPKVRFESLMPMLSAKDAAVKIMRAQRRNERVLVMPWYYATVNKWTRLLPTRAEAYVRDFLGAGVESDL